MSIRKQLNTAYLGGCVVTAGVFGLMAENWWMFIVVLVVLLAFRLCERQVQPK